MNDRHFEKIMFKSSYGLNEDVKYNKIDSSYFQDDDEIDIMGEEENEEDNQELSDEPEADIESNEIEDNSDDSESMSDDVSSEDSSNEQEEKNYDLVQNEIIKSTISTMNMIHDKMRDLESKVNNLNNEYDKLKNDVDEVKEPSNIEKLTQHKEDSFPYYNNLNDVWKDDNNKSDLFNDKIVKLKNGEYAAIFDDIDNRLSSVDLEKSYYNYD